MRSPLLDQRRAKALFKRIKYIPDKVIVIAQVGSDHRDIICLVVLYIPLGIKTIPVFDHKQGYTYKRLLNCKVMTVLGTKPVTFKQLTHRCYIPITVSLKVIIVIHHSKSGVEKYLSAVSGRIVTTVLPSPSFSASLSAAATFVPLEMPHIIPSFEARSLAVCIASSSVTI